MVVSVISFIEDPPPDIVESCQSWSSLNKNAGFLGGQRGHSLHSMKTTSNIDGLFMAFSCTHKSPI
jgi:hypothetical protein